MRLTETPRKRPSPTSSGETSRSSSSQLGDLARLDELAQPRLDPRADPAQLADAALPHELRDRRGRRADQLGRAPVGARGVRPGARELEQRGERVEPRGDLGVVRR